MNKERDDAAKHSAPKVSSRGNDRKCVSGIASVWGWKTAFSAIYIHPAKPYTNTVKVAACISRRIPLVYHYCASSIFSVVYAGLGEPS